MFDKNKKPKKNWLFVAMLSFYLVKKLFKIQKNRGIKAIEHNFKDYLKEEGKEIKKYAKGKESIEEFAEDSGSIFRDYFIPHSGNNHMPKILHTKSLAIIVLLSIVFKFALVAYLYFIFPNSGKADDLMVPKLFELVNKEREANGLKKLTLNPVLSNSALSKANDIVSKDYFAHTSPDGRKPWDFIDRTLYPYSLVGENLAMNFTSAESAHKALVNSPSHKHNLLHDKYQDIGLAVVSGEVGGKKTNILVQMFSVKVALETPVKPVPVASVPVADAKTETKPAVEKVAVLSYEQSVTKTPIVEQKPVAVPAKPAPTTVAEPVKEPVKTLVNTEPVQEPIEKDPETMTPDASNIDAVTSTGTKATIAKTMKIIKHPGDQVLSDFVDQKLSYEQTLIAATEKSLPEVNISSEFSNDKNFILSKRFIYLTQVVIASLLSLLIISLLLNIFIRFEIQHKPVLIRTMLVMVFVAALLFFNFHYLESGAGVIYMS